MNLLRSLSGGVYRNANRQASRPTVVDVADAETRRQQGDRSGIDERRKVPRFAKEVEGS
jgi:hypothetical protein